MQNLKRDKCISLAKAIYDDMKKRILGARTTNNIPMTQALIDKKRFFNTFQYRAKVINVGFGLSQIYLPLRSSIEITTQNWTFNVILNNKPEGATGI